MGLTISSQETSNEQPYQQKERQEQVTAVLEVSTPKQNPQPLRDSISGYNGNFIAILF